MISSWTRTTHESRVFTFIAELLMIRVPDRHWQHQTNFSSLQHSYSQTLIKPKGLQSQRRANPLGLWRWNCENPMFLICIREEQSILSRIGFLLLGVKGGGEGVLVYKERWRDNTWEELWLVCILKKEGGKVLLSKILLALSRCHGLNKVLVAPCLYRV